MTRLKANALLDAATVLVGWTNRSATRDTEKLFTSGEVVRLNTKLDAASRFSMLVSHPGHSAAVTVVLHLAPELRDGTRGTFIPVATFAVPAEGDRVEAYISGHDILLDAADADNADLLMGYRANERGKLSEDFVAAGDGLVAFGATFILPVQTH
jgi:hypothetical protein